MPPKQKESTTIVKQESELGEYFCCKECGYIMEQNVMANWSSPTTTLKKAAVLFGHPTENQEEPFKSCVTGKIKPVENYSTGMLMHDITNIVFKFWNYLGKLNWWDLNVDYIFISSTKTQTITENSLHTSIIVPAGAENLGEVEIKLPNASDFPPYGLDIYIHIAQPGTYVKLTGFPQDIWLTSRSHHVLGCYCGTLAGFLISSGKYLTIDPAI
jgi:hypothetical protein